MKGKLIDGLCAVLCMLSACVASGNVLDNSGFESGSGTNIIDWMHWDGVRLEEWAAQAGTNGLAMQGWTAGGGVYQDHAFERSSNYTFAAWGFRDGDFTNTLTVEMKIEFLDVSQDLLTAVTNTITGSDTWQMFSVSGTSPSDTAIVRPVLAFGGMAGSGGAFKWDDLSLESSALPTGIYYVAQGGGHIAPYTNWMMAATNIQDAVALANDGSTVLVSNGVYDSGPTGFSFCVLLTNRITVKSVNGPGATIIEGAGPIGPDALRCAYVGDGAVLDGFTLTNGHTLSDFSYDPMEVRHKRASGGGVWVEAGGYVTNCRIVNCSSALFGGGVYGNGSGVLAGCLIAGNSCYDEGGGAADAILTSCVISNNAAGFLQHGGGTYNCNNYSCLIVDNTGHMGGGICGGTTLDSTICGNDAPYEGGAAQGGYLRNCALVNNTSGLEGGGASGASLENCTVIANSTDGNGGGLIDCTAENCLVYYNTAVSAGDNWYNGSMSYCCTVPLPEEGTGNVAGPPGLLSDDCIYLLSNSPCVNAGLDAAWMSGSSDIEGESRLSGTVDIGCDEYHDNGMTGSLAVVVSAVYTGAVKGFDIPFQCWIDGRASGSEWVWGDGVSSEDCCYVAHAFPVSGRYDVILSAWNHDNNVSVTVKVEVVDECVTYVSPGGGHIAPFASWDAAATTIQAAVSANVYAGGTVMVSNGVYESGGCVADGALTNRVAVTTPLNLVSVNGPEHTEVVGVGPQGDAAVRCVYLTAQSRLVGFTLRDGSTMSYGADTITERSGAGVCCGGEAVISNCIIRDCSANRFGGGVYKGAVYDSQMMSNTCNYRGAAAYDTTIYRSEIIGNFASSAGGAVCYCALYDCLVENNESGDHGGALYAGSAQGTTIRNNVSDNYGGGAYDSVLKQCIISGNSARYAGGGMYFGEVQNSLLHHNSCGSIGGGLAHTEADNCTIVFNTADRGGGTWGGVLNSCIIYYNTFTNYGQNYSGGTINYSCVFPAETNGVSNITNAPGFSDSGNDDYSLTEESACIDAGENTALNVDLCGVPRALDGNGDGIVVADIGAYEFVNVLADSDLDKMNDYAEIMAGTDPLDASSCLSLNGNSATDWMNDDQIVIRWASVESKRYTLLRSTSLTTTFSAVCSNIVATPPQNIYTDSVSVVDSTYYYRILVE